MKAEIKYLHSPDIIESLNEYKPQYDNKFGFLLQMMIGPKGEEGEESFDIMVCTPEWLKENYNDDNIIFGHHLLIVFKYDYQAIYKKLSEYVNNVNGNTWDEICTQLGRIGRWEFEDYKN